MTSGTPERRGAQIEFRAAGRRLEGYAATFGTAALVGNFTETIMRGAFRDTLARDVLALADHDPTKVLARTRTGTLRLAEDDHGLAFSLQLPETQAGRDVLALAERGDLGGMSFGFTVAPGGERWSQDGKRRELRSLVLHEISVVSAWPAYPDTVVVARSVMVPALRLKLARLFLETT